MVSGHYTERSRRIGPRLGRKGIRVTGGTFMLVNGTDGVLRGMKSEAMDWDLLAFFFSLFKEYGNGIYQYAL